MPKVIFICEANSTRSQLAHGLAQARWGKSVVVESAGSFAIGGISGVNYYVRKVLQLRKFDYSVLYSKGINQVVDLESFDLVVILCGRDFVGKTFPHAQKLHRPLGIPGVVMAEKQHSLLASYQALAAEIEQLLRVIEQKYLPIFRKG